MALNFCAGAALKHIPFVMITTKSTSDSIVATKEAGVSSWIFKSFNTEALKHKLVCILGEF